MESRGAVLDCAQNCARVQARKLSVVCKHVRDRSGRASDTVGLVREGRGQLGARKDLLREGVGPMGGMESLVGDAAGDSGGGRSLLRGRVGRSGGTADRSGDADERKGGEAGRRSLHGFLGLRLRNEREQAATGLVKEGQPLLQTVRVLVDHVRSAREGDAAPLELLLRGVDIHDAEI